jgi:hypothetical protein
VLSWDSSADAALNACQDTIPISEKLEPCALRAQRPSESEVAGHQRCSHDSLPHMLQSAVAQSREEWLPGKF